MGTYKLRADTVSQNTTWAADGAYTIPQAVFAKSDGKTVGHGGTLTTLNLRFNVKYYLDGSASPTEFASLPSGFTPTSAAVSFGATPGFEPIPGSEDYYLQFDASTESTSITVDGSGNATFAWPGTIPSPLFLYNNGVGVRVTKSNAGFTADFDWLEVSGNYDIAQWYFNSVTNHYQFATSDPGAPWALGTPTLTVTSINAPYGSECGGGSVTITGTGFGDGATVTIGGVAATSVVVLNSTTITCLPGVHATGTVDVVVTNSDSTTGTLTNGFTYQQNWWLKLLTLIVNPNTPLAAAYTLETWVHQCASPGTGYYVVLGAPALAWWTLGGWYLYQVDNPGGWAASAAPPTGGWYFSTAAYGGNVTIVSAGRPKDPRTWAQIVSFATGNAGMLGGSPAASCTTNNRLIYPGSDYTVGTTYPSIRIFDGSFDHELCRLPPTTTNTVPKALMTMLAANGTIYVTTLDSGTSSADWAGRVMQLDIDSGTLVPVGDAPFTTGQLPYALAWHAGRLWCGTNKGDGTAGKVYFFRPGIDAAWTLDHTLSTDSVGGVDSMLSFGGKLYVGSDNAAASFAKILVRDTAGAYTTSDTGSGGTARANNGFLSMVVFGTNLYASYWNQDTPAVAKIRKFDGTTWTTSFTGATTTLRPYIVLLVDNAALFAFGGGCSLSAAILSTPDGTTWTNLTAELPDTTETLLPVIGVEVL